MQLIVGTEITAETIFETIITGEVTAILERSVIIENDAGRHVIKRDTLKKMGYKVNSSDRTDTKYVPMHRYRAKKQS